MDESLLPKPNYTLEMTHCQKAKLFSFKIQTKSEASGNLVESPKCFREKMAKSVKYMSCTKIQNQENELKNAVEEDMSQWKGRSTN